MSNTRETRTKILYVFGGERAQGAEIVIERLMTYNIERVEPHLFVSPGKFADNLLQSIKPYKIIRVNELRKLYRSSSSKYRYYFSAFKNYFTISYKVYNYIAKNRIGVVHANTIVPSSYLIPLILFSKLTFRSVKWVWSDHDLNYYSKIDHLLSKLCLKSYDLTLVVSEAVKNKFNSNKKVVVLYNGLDPTVFRSNIVQRNEFRKKWEIEESLIVFGMAAVISPIKGQLALIDVFNQLNITFPHIKLLLTGGEAHDTPKYTTQVKSAIELNKNITHIGFITLVTYFYNACDIIISNSNITGSEPLGTSIIEAMACEKIVVAAKTGGTPEIVTDGMDGFMFTPENYEELLETLTRVIRDFNSFGNIGALARKKVTAKFNILNMVEEYNKLLTLPSN